MGLQLQGKHAAGQKMRSCVAHGNLGNRYILYTATGVSNYPVQNELRGCSPDLDVVWADTRTAIVKGDSIGLAELSSSAEVSTQPPTFEPQCSGNERRCPKPNVCAMNNVSQ
jgi:hypothetical protein